MGNQPSRKWEFFVPDTVRFKGRFLNYLLYLPSSVLTFVNLLQDFQLPVKRNKSGGGFHSPLSPLSQSSPLFPDGIMSPMWIRKQQDTKPGVLVMFSELPALNDNNEQKVIGPLAAVSVLEREKDATLVSEIVEHRKNAQEAGTKFAMVLMLRVHDAENPTIEDRISSIRRASGLDQRNSFFVLPPLGPPELQEFISNLQRSLYEPAINFYREKGKLMKKKRSRIPIPQPPKSPVINANPEKLSELPLSNLGWLVRYDFKMGAFAEFRQDPDSALKYYGSCYMNLVDMFSPSVAATTGCPAIIPNTKRWTEARILAEAIHLKICKLYFYMDSPNTSLIQMQRHLDSFSNILTAAGITSETFEYWAWLSKQYRAFAELVELATKHGMRIPSPEQQASNMYVNGAGLPDLRTGYSSGHPATVGGGVYPGLVIQHAGFYYYSSATCSMERRRCLLKASESTDLSTQDSINTEKKFDHTAIIIELLTKSYEQFKKYKNARMTLFLASEIAKSYYEGGKFEMALKFFERIAKTYRKENWSTILASILHSSLVCSRELKLWKNAIGYLIELLSDEVTLNIEMREGYQRELVEILSRQTDDNQQIPMIIDLDQMNTFVHFGIQFERGNAFVGAPVKFQLTATTSCPLPLEISSLRLVFNDSSFDHHFHHVSDEASELKGSVWIDAKDAQQKETDDGLAWSKEVDLRLSNECVKVIEGSITPREIAELKVAVISCHISTPGWQLTLNYPLTGHDETFKKAKWLQVDQTNDDVKRFVTLDEAEDRTTLRVTHRKPKMEMNIECEQVALLDEAFPVNVTIISQEEHRAQTTLTAEIKSGAGQRVSDTFTHDLGQVNPGGEKRLTFFIRGSQPPRERLLTLTLRYYLDSPDIINDQLNVYEKRETLQIEFQQPFQTEFKVYPENFLAPNDPDSLSRTEHNLLVTQIKSIALADLEVQNIELKIAVSLFKPGSVFSCSHLMSFETEDITTLKESVEIGHIEIAWKRRQPHPTLKENIFNTVLTVPRVGMTQSPLNITLDAPTEIYLATPFTFVYNIENTSSEMQELVAILDASNNLIFSGYKQHLVRLLPLSITKLRFNGYALAPGKLTVPKLRLVEPGSEHEGVSLNNEELAIFVKPAPAMVEV
ncbi:hypothetical protein K493DRAFT_203903 [Basidiobolus meristosporus CBS 931.73]|uniref:Trafficking protein particle complex subunit 11 domain-containing protein n=1 Tax=Basidiobolus meristosporus CBS 931.73 TaxID=1314790 RepID=A0A1Y1Z6Y5_9FUNG|nr:hypothetical protein K493DRAFT_203903 [Basidiobolus meristosporus CBS 931.73]|eukprot:ORY05966.1 hypothetical protein K493DRAFT_203903 [Basidiobolus meristosporus CBS 931.73]